MKPSLTAVLLVSALSLGGCKQTQKPDDLDEGVETETQPESTAAEEEASDEVEPAETAGTDSPLDGPVFHSVAETNWKKGPGSLPPGSEVAILEGTPPFHEQSFTLLLKFPSDYTIAPHTHGVTERVTVLEGPISFGHGEVLDKASGTEVGQGAYVTMPYQHVHYAFSSDEEAIVQLQGVGPWGIFYVNPDDDPRDTPVEKPDYESPYDTEITASTTTASEITWEDAPELGLPSGAQVAMLEGDPSVDGKTFVLRVKLPDGARLPVQNHGMTARFTVVSGTLQAATGDTWTDGELQDMTAPAVVIVPKEDSYYGQAKGETVLQFFGIGPFEFASEGAATASVQ